jgi:chaperonin GroEL
MNNNIHNYALKSIADGIHIATQQVSPTMGSCGVNVLVKIHEYPYRVSSNDGAFIISHLYSENPLHNEGFGILQEAVGRSNSNAGDGSTTTCVLLDALTQNCINSNFTGLKAKKEIDTILPVILDGIKSQTKQITSEQIEQIAFISGEDKNLAQTLSEIYKKIGAEGNINLQSSGTYETTYSFINGIRFHGLSLISPFLVHDDEAVREKRSSNKAIYEKPNILLSNKKITSLHEINNLIEGIKMRPELENNIVIVTTEIDTNVARNLVSAHREGLFNILILRVPVIRGSYVLEDLAICTGATVIDDLTGVNFKNMKLAHFGTCDRIESDDKDTIILGVKDISDHIASLQDKLKENENDFDTQERLKYLNQKTALLKLGAKSEREYSYLRLKAEDAIYSCKSALREGVVAGGGLCLWNVAQTLPNTPIGNIIKSVLETPLRTICANAMVTDPILLNIGGEIGVDTQTCQAMNMVENGIIDSSHIVQQAIQNSFGIASTILTTPSFIDLPPQQNSLEAQLKQLLLSGFTR